MSNEKKVKGLKKGAQEFKEFISQGNVVDMAVGVIIGTAFGKIISSLVNDVLMPVIGIILGGIDFTGLVAKVGDAKITYGVFIQSVIDFLIIAFCIFMVIKLFERFKHSEKEEEIPTKPENVMLLEEIRDLLKERK